MPANNSTCARKRQCPAEDASSAEDVTSITTNDGGNESHRAPDELGVDEINLILKPCETIKAVHLEKTLGSICRSLGGIVYMVDSTELNTMGDDGYICKKEIEDSIKHSNTILLPMFLRRNLYVHQRHWVLVVVSHNAIILAPPRMYCAAYSSRRIIDAQDLTASFLRNYIISQDTAGNSLLPSACCSQTQHDDSGVFVFAFGMYAIANCPLPLHLPVDIWRLIMAYLLGFKDDKTVQRDNILSKHKVDSQTLEAAFTKPNKDQLETHRTNVDNFMTSYSDILTVLKTVQARMTEGSGRRQSSQDITTAGYDESTIGRETTSRERLGLAIANLSALDEVMDPLRDEISNTLLEMEMEMKRKLPQAGV